MGRHVLPSFFLFIIRESCREITCRGLSAPKLGLRPAGPANTEPSAQRGRPSKDGDEAAGSAE